MKIYLLFPIWFITNFAFGQINKTQFITLIGLVEGKYDNIDQVNENPKNGRMHIELHKVKLDFLGDYVFFMKYYKDNDPDKLYRQRLLVFSYDSTNQALSSEAMSFKADSLYFDFWKKPLLIQSLTKADIRPSLGCKNWWIQTEDGFIGKSEACPFFSSKRGKKILIYDKLKINKDGIATTEAGKDPDGTLLFGNMDTFALILKRQ